MTTTTSWEAHSLNSLSKRILTPRSQLAVKLSAGEIQPLPGSHDRKLIFTTDQLDRLRDAAVTRLSAHLDKLGLTEAERQKVVAVTVQLCEEVVDIEIADANKGRL